MKPHRDENVQKRRALTGSHQGKTAAPPPPPPPPPPGWPLPPPPPPPPVPRRCPSRSRSFQVVAVSRGTRFVLLRPEGQGRRRREEAIDPAPRPIDQRMPDVCHRRENSVTDAGGGVNFGGVERSPPPRVAAATSAPLPPAPWPNPQRHKKKGNSCTSCAHWTPCRTRYPSISFSLSLSLSLCVHLLFYLSEAGAGHTATAFDRAMTLAFRETRVLFYIFLRTTGAPPEYGPGPGLSSSPL